MGGFRVYSIFLFFFVVTCSNVTAWADAQSPSSAEELAQSYIQYHDLKDKDKIFNLYDLDGVSAAFIEELNQRNIGLFGVKFLTHKILPLPPNYIVSFQREGKKYTLSLSPVGLIEFDFNNGGQAAFTIPYSLKDGKFYFVTRKEIG